MMRTTIEDVRETGPHDGHAASSLRWRRPGAESDLLLVVLLGVVWGSAFPVIRAGLVAGAPPLFFAGIRYGLTAAALVPIALLTRAPFPSRRNLLSPAVFGGLFMVGGYGGLLYIGEGSTSGGLAAILTASAPLASALLGYRLLPTERFGGWGSLGLAIGFVGVTVLVLPQLSGPLASSYVGPLFVVGAVVAFALGSVLLRKTSSLAPSFWTLALQFAIAGVAVSAIGAGFGEPATVGRAQVVWPTLAFLVLLPGILGYRLYFRVHHSSGPTRANLVGYVNPVTGVLVGLLVFGEIVTVVEIAGMILIAGGLFLLQRDRRHRTMSSRTTTGLASPDGGSPSSSHDSREPSR
jgi:probable blue pigment (indigoidine) exporter